jgi:hypothetical protein
MIPSDVASRLQVTADAAVSRVPSTQQVSDVLADLVPGQRVLAEIQALLPNGAYRALINQRDVTLALPFSAKAGDSLELEVVDNDGTLALAVVARRQGQSDANAGGERPAVETTLSRTGNFIAGLLARSDEGEPAKPAPLNANQPIAAAPPAKGADLVPLLKQALSQSGMFYESHQSQWLGNQLTTQTLLTQPQGQLSPLLQQTPQAQAGEVQTQQANALVGMNKAPDGAAKPAELAATLVSAGAEQSVASRSAMVSTQLVAPDLLPLVQQQLEALASQTYIWNGQAWPGQAMRWEIVEENDGQAHQDGEAEQAPWQTRLTLIMPQLGEVRAALRISGGELTLSLSTLSNEAAIQLANGGDGLRNQMEAAGLTLSGFTVGRHGQPEE